MDLDVNKERYEDHPVAGSLNGNSYQPFFFIKFPEGLKLFILAMKMLQNGLCPI